MRRTMLILWVVAGLVVSIDARADSIVGTAKGKVYHNHPDRCSSAKRIQSDNIARFASKAEAERAGRRQCKSCAKYDSEPVTKAPDSAAAGQSSNAEQRPGVVPVVADRPATDGGSTQSSGALLPQFAHAKKIIDGGTIELDTGDKARLLGIIVPNGGQPSDREAHRFIKEQTRDRLLKLSLPASSGDAMERDALGRWRVSIAPQGGRDLAGELLFQGYAWLNRDRITARTEEYARLEEAAWSARRGIWRQLEGEEGQRIVATGRGATEYHDDRCAHVAHLTDPMNMTINEARARRLVPCDDYRAKGSERSSSD